jgi:hypothetical protein
MKNRTYLLAVAAILLFWIFVSALTSLVFSLEKRVSALEKVCHSACKYGDEECVKRCLSQGHCPAENGGY